MGVPCRAGLFVVTCMLATGTAQERPAAPATPPAQGPRGVLVDMVVATVNDSAVLLSQLRTVATGQIKTFVAQHGSINQAEQQLILERALQSEIDDLRLALAAKSFGVLSPEQIEDYVRADLERDRKAKERDLGSVTELSQELKKTNRTLQMMEQEERTDKLRQIARELTIGRRLGGRLNLWLTPRMLRETYAENRDRFVRDAASRVVQVRFRGAEAESQARQAAATWRGTELDARQLADRHPGSVALGEMTAETLQQTVPAMAAFALAGPEGAVSDPIPVGTGGDFLVGRVTMFTPARNSPFEDAAVQAELRDLCLDRVVKVLQADGMRRAADRTEVWRLPGSR